MLQVDYNGKQQVSVAKGDSEAEYELTITGSNYVYVLPFGAKASVVMTAKDGHILLDTKQVDYNKVSFRILPEQFDRLRDKDNKLELIIDHLDGTKSILPENKVFEVLVV